MLKNLAKKIALALLLFLTFAPKAQACFGCTPIEFQLFAELPILGLIFLALPLYVLISFFCWLLCDRKSYDPLCENLNRVLNCFILSCYDYAAIVFITELVPPRLRIFKIISPIFINPLFLTFVACCALRKSKWANHLFASCWGCLIPFAIAFLTIAFDGRRYAQWDAARSAGMFFFGLLLLLIWMSIPATMRPYWPREKQKTLRSIRGLSVSKPIFISPNATCGLCGELIGHDYVTCSDCATPMHKECWEWNERTCVVYGCQSQRLKPKRRIKALGRRRVRTLALATS